VEFQAPQGKHGEGAAVYKLGDFKSGNFLESFRLGGFVLIRRLQIARRYHRRKRQTRPQGFPSCRSHDVLFSQNSLEG
jgi:hypothetical protein